MEKHILGDTMWWACRNIISSPVFPLKLTEFQFAIAVYDPFSFESARIRVISPNGEEVIYFDISMALSDGVQQLDTDQDASITFTQSGYPVWTFHVFSVTETSSLIKQPGQYPVTLVRNGEDETTIGCLNFGLRQVPTLTEDRIRALKSDPLAIKYAQFLVKCNECDDELCAYAGLDKNDELEEERCIWYRNLPEFFECQCGKGTVDLSIARENLHALLRNVALDDRQISFTRMYEKESLEAVCNDFSHLLDQDPREEEVQKYVESNSILLQQFSPIRVFYKSPILSKYQTDIAILNQKGELLLSK